MRERVTKLISVLFITSSLLVALFPFYFVSAEEGSYTILTAGNCTKVLKASYQSRGNNYYSTNIDVRAIIIYENSGDGNVILMSENNFKALDYYSTSETPSCGVPTNFVNNIYRKNGVAYYYLNNTNTNFGLGLRNNPLENECFIKSYVRDFNYNNILDQAYYYLYGDGAVDPAPPAPNYGDLIIDGYKTDVAGQGDASINNIDHILWNGFVDTNGNDISNLEVRLQIVPGTYTSDSKAHLLEQTYEDLIIDINSAHEQVYDASLGEVSFKWSDIVDMLNITPYKLWSLQLFGVDWQKEGWIYRIRLEDSDNDYVGNWQTIYSSTSSGVQNDLTIINSTSIDQTYITALQEVNNLNTVNNNWTVNNTEISVTNDYTEPSSGDKPWWAYLLESILNTFNITNNYIYEGDSNTQNIINTVNDSDDDMNDKIAEYQQFEDTFIDDMDSNLTDIDTNIDFLSDNKFIASANWVTQQYNRMTTNNVIGSFIGFSLLFGLALIFIGKIR